MQYKTKTSKNIKPISLLTFLFIGLCAFTTQAQKNKIDGVDVVIGKNIVLNSDIAKFKLDIEKRSEGKFKISDCEMLEQIMLQKLLSHHAVIDSVIVTAEEVNKAVSNNIRYFIQQFGSEEAMVKAYGFNDAEDLRKELFIIEKENALVRKEQQNINEKVDVTPEEVRIYYNGLKEKNELPEFQAEIELAQIVIHATPTKEETDRVVKKLFKIKKEIEEGASIRMKAILNSEDPAVVNNGGKYTITKESNFIKKFKEVAFSLDINQISEPFKSEFGYHIIQLHEIKGNQRIASHILLQPEIPDTKLKETQAKIDKIRKEILENKITFEAAVKKYSDDTDTKQNGGLILNPQTNESTFDLTRMDPALYARVSAVKKGEITESFYDESQGGEKMYKIILMRDRTDAHTADLINDYVKVQQLALQKKKEENITKWAKEKIKDTYIKLNETHKKCKFDKNWKKESK
jgi:peptidyl-prolyl cis-trans isomerase SurA